MDTIITVGDQQRIVLFNAGLQSEAASGPEKEPTHSRAYRTLTTAQPPRTRLPPLYSMTYNYRPRAVRTIL
jgi:hypothetical protein